MSSEVLIRAAGICKTYAGSRHPLTTLHHALFGGRLDPEDEFHVLTDINLEIHRGEAVGILGRNGAGKTTLLGILGKVIQPSGGTVERHGRIATLLGLSTGFNPNFTGRENAQLFCSVQGLSQHEANEKIAYIEDFADLGRYFDLPLRTYSSGMQSRLAFSCAIHVAADLIIIDETLAVGDANFRMKCYDRIRQMKDEGQSFMLVSHNQNLVANFCTRGVVLEGGRKVFDGATQEAVETYKRIRTEAMQDDDLKGKVLKQKAPPQLNRDAELTDFRLEDGQSGNEKFGIVRTRLKAHRAMEHVAVNFGIRNQEGIVVCAWDAANAGKALPRIDKGELRDLSLKFIKRLLPGRYYVSCAVNELVGDVTKPICLYQNFLSFDITDANVMVGIADLSMDMEVNERLGEADVSSRLEKSE
jgi:ABC-type polysaccharide/polyol phosphate transport system ATPase subunit